MMIARTRLGLGPLRDLAQLEATIACLRRIPGVGTVTVDRFDDRRALLALQLLRPVDLPAELRGVLGSALGSCEVTRDRVELHLAEGPVCPVDGGRAATAPADWRRAAWADVAASPWSASGGPEAAEVEDAVVVEDDDPGPGAVRPALPASGPRLALGVGDDRRTDVTVVSPVDVPARSAAPARSTPAAVPAVRPAADSGGTRGAAPAPYGPTALERAVDAADLVVTALEAMSDVSILVFDHDRRFRASAGAALRRHGYRHDDVVGRPASDVLPGHVWTRLRPGYDAALRGDRLLLEHEAEDGTRYEVDFRPVLDGDDVIGGLAVSRDVSARIADPVAPADADADAPFARSFDDAPIAKALADPSGRWLRVNRRLAELLGRDADELVRDGAEAVVHPDDAAQASRLRREALAGLRDRFVVRQRCRHVDGGTVDLRLEAAVVRASDGRPRLLVLEFVDRPDRAELLPHHDPEVVAV